jgi:hypothetical protein
VANSLLHSILYGFAVYSLIALLYNLFPDSRIKNKIEKFDQSVCTFIPVVGLLLLIINILYLYSEITITPNPNEGDLLQRITGPYWYAYWFQYIIYLSPVLLWITRLRKNELVRIIVSIIILFPLERIVNYLTSFNHDYQQNNWTMYHPEQITNWLWHSVIFCLVAVIFHRIRLRFMKNMK